MPGDVEHVMAFAPQSEPEDLDGITRQPLRASLTPDLPADGYVLRPKEGASRTAVLAVPGHGVGVKAAVGLGPAGGYMNDFALTLARRGHVVVALEPVGFGSRRGERASRVGPEETDCYEPAMIALLAGQTLLGWRVAEAMAAVRAMRAMPGVERVGVVGISGGGTVALFTAALETTIWAAYISGYLASHRGSIAATRHCCCNFVPGLSTWFRASDIAALVAPRMLVVESGDADRIFPPNAVAEAVNATREAFACVGGTFSHCPFQGGHIFHGGGLDAFDKSLTQLP